MLLFDIVFKQDNGLRPRFHNGIRKSKQLRTNQVHNCFLYISVIFKINRTNFIQQSF